MTQFSVAVKVRNEVPQRSIEFGHRTAALGPDHHATPANTRICSNDRLGLKPPKPEGQTKLPFAFSAH